MALEEDNQEKAIEIIQPIVPAQSVEELYQRINTLAEDLVSAELDYKAKLTKAHESFTQIVEDGKRLGVDIDQIREALLQKCESLGVGRNELNKSLPAELKQKQFTPKNVWAGGANTKQELEFIEQSEKTKEQLLKENYHLKIQFDELKKRVEYLESLNLKEEWQDTGLCDIGGKAVPIKATVNSKEQRIKYYEIDIEYIKRKKAESKERQTK